MKDKPEWLANGIVTLLFTTRPERHPDYPNIPTLTELAPADKKNLLIALNGPATMSRTMTGPPGVPAAVLAEMRDAFKRMNEDPAFQKEMDDLKSALDDLTAKVNRLVALQADARKNNS